MGEAINPRQDRQLGDDEELVFLAGPIQGAPDWQMDLAPKIIQRRPGIVVATPRAPGNVDRESFDFNEQVDWEDEHLWRAAKLGGIVFYFAAQDARLPYREGRAYAQTTRIELGKILGWRRFMPVNVAVGFDPEYKGGSERYIRRMLERDEVSVASGADELLERIDADILKQL